MSSQKTLRQAVDTFYRKIQHKKCAVVRCTNSVIPGYILCGDCRTQWQKETRLVSMVPDHAVGAENNAFC